METRQIVNLLSLRVGILTKESSEECHIISHFLHSSEAHDLSGVLKLQCS